MGACSKQLFLFRVLPLLYCFKRILEEIIGKTESKKVATLFSIVFRLIFHDAIFHLSASDFGLCLCSFLFFVVVAVVVVVVVVVVVFIVAVLVFFIVDFFVLYFFVVVVLVFVVFYSVVVNVVVFVFLLFLMFLFLFLLIIQSLYYSPPCFLRV